MRAGRGHWVRHRYSICSLLLYLWWLSTRALAPFPALPALCYSRRERDALVLSVYKAQLMSVWQNVTWDSLKNCEEPKPFPLYVSTRATVRPSVFWMPCVSALKFALKITLPLQTCCQSKCQMQVNCERDNWFALKREERMLRTAG